MPACASAAFSLDIFGTNGRRVLDGMAEGLEPEAILASLSWHVQNKMERLGDALRLSLSVVDRLIVRDLLRDHDALDERIEALDRDIEDGLGALGGAHRPAAHHSGYLASTMMWQP